VRKVAAALPHRAAQQGRNRLNLLFFNAICPCQRRQSEIWPGGAGAGAEA
jgi:hypothetical protein